jgi:MFS family permease
MLSFLGLFGTSVVAPAEPVIAAYVHSSIEVTTLSAALFILGMRLRFPHVYGNLHLTGFALGPMVWAPASELWGRRWSILPATFVFGLFSIATATSKNLASILVKRFFAGVFASAATSNSPATLGDVFEPRVRATAMGIWTQFVIAGPTLAPVIGAAVTANKHLRWRCTFHSGTIATMNTKVNL